MLALNGIMTFLRETTEYPEKCAWKHDMSSMFERYVRVGDLILAGKQQKELESDCKHLHQFPVASVTNDHQLGISNNRYVFSHISEDKTFRTSITGMK